jgi:hypothetical protein
VVKNSSVLANNSGLSNKENISISNMGITIAMTAIINIALMAKDVMRSLKR